MSPTRLPLREGQWQDQLQMVKFIHYSISNPGVEVVALAKEA